MDRLLFVYPDVQGGVKSYITNLTKELNNYNIDFKILTYSYRNSLFHRKRSTTNKTDIVFSRSSKRKSQYKYLRSEINFNDLIVCNDSFELEAINFLRLPNKLVYILHGDLKHYKSILDSYNLCIDLVLCVSNGLKVKYEALFSHLKIEVCHPIVIRNLPQKRIETNKFKCLYIGRFEYLKGADLFLNLINTLHENIGWTVVTTSKGSEASLLNKVPANVSVYYDIPNCKVMDLLQNVDVLIFPSRTEGFGIAVLEASTMGVIPLVLDIPIGIPDQVIDGVNGFVIKEKNWNEEASWYLKKLASDKALLADMKQNAILFAKERFNTKAIIERFLIEINNCTLRKDKKFQKTNRSFFEDNIPESIYRIFKIINTKIKYG